MRMRKGCIAVVKEHPVSESEQATWILVLLRVGINRTSTKEPQFTLICCFRETVARHMCSQTKISWQPLNDELFSAQKVSGSNAKMSTYMPFEETLSQLPLTVASCPRSTKLDFDAGQVARQGETVIVLSPTGCRFCGTRRGSAYINERKGVLLSSYGLCKLNVHTFRCQNSTCARDVSADGREYCMNFENITTGITHIAMRQTCEGVVLGSGTLKARLQELLKKHVTSRNAGIGDHSVEPRSVKTLLRVCVFVCTSCKGSSIPVLHMCDLSTADIHADEWKCASKNDRTMR